MSKSKKSSRRLFYVVQFIEGPFKDVNDYVCVPHTWLVELIEPQREATDGKAVVAYPKDEDPSVTIERIKRRKRYDVEWMFYIALIKYETDSYSDAENWIKAKRIYRPCEEEKSEMRDMQPEPVLSRKTRSAKHPSAPKIKSNKPQLTGKRRENPRKPLTRMSIRRQAGVKAKRNLDNMRLKLDEAKPNEEDEENTSIAPENSQCRKSITKASQLIQSTQTKITAGSENVTTNIQPEFGEIVQSSLPKLICEKKASPVAQGSEQALSEYVINLDESDDDDVIAVAQKVQLECVTERDQSSCKSFPKQLPQPDSINNERYPPNDEDLPQETYPKVISTRQSEEAYDSRKTDEGDGQSKEPYDSRKTELYRLLTSPTPTKPPKTANQSSQQYQDNQSPLLPKRSTNPQPLLTNSTKVTQKHQRRCSEDFLSNTAFTYKYVPSSTQLSSQLFEPVNRQQKSSSVIKNPVEQKTCLENVARTSTTQHPSNLILQLQPSLPNSSVESKTQTPACSQKDLQELVNKAIIKRQLRQHVMNRSAAESLVTVAHHSRTCVEQTHTRTQQCLQTKEDYSRVQEMLGKPHMALSINQKAYLPNALTNEGFDMQNQLRSTNQSSHVLPQHEYQNLPINRDDMQQIVRHELLWDHSGAHTEHRHNSQSICVNIPLAAQNLGNVPNQFHQSSKQAQQMQNTMNNQDPCAASIHIDLSLTCKSNVLGSQVINEQGIVNKAQLLNQPQISNLTSLPLPNIQKGYLLQDPRTQRRLNQSAAEHHHADLAAVSDNITVESVDVHYETYATLSSDQSREMQTTVAPGNNVFLHPRTQTMVVDQVSGTHVISDIDHCKDESTRLDGAETSTGIAGSACQTDKELRLQEVGSDFETVDNHETVSDQVVVVENKETDSSLVDITRYREPYCLGNLIPNESNTEERPTTVRNLTIVKRLTQHQMDADADEQMLDVFGAIVTEMCTNMSYTRELFSEVRNSTRVCAELSQKLLERVEKFIQIPDHDHVTSEEVPQSIEGKSVEVTGKKKSGNNSDVNCNGPKRKKFSFVLPPEYDPNDSKWTLKYREKKPGLLELMSKSGVYVSKTGFENSKRVSNDCKTLARMLLVEVFSKNALSVCSLTGERARAFKDVDMDVRPGLDAYARIVLLTFIVEYGKKRRWNTSDLQILTSMRTKINKMRAKYGRQKILYES